MPAMAGAGRMPACRVFFGVSGEPKVTLNILINIMFLTLFLSRRYAARQRKSRKPKSRKIHDTSRKKSLRSPLRHLRPNRQCTAGSEDGYGGHGLSLLVTPRKSGGFSKTWAQAISPNGTKTSLGLGSYPVVTLAMAREKALANARAIAEGRDPRRRMQRVPTFEMANETVVAIHARHWKSGRTEGQWRASMRDYVLPRLAASASTPSPPPTSWRCCCLSGPPSA